MEQGTMEVGSGAVSIVTWLTHAVSGVNTLRGVELDTGHVLLHHVRALGLVVLWILAYAANVVLHLLRTPVPVLTPALRRLSTLAEEYDTGPRVHQASSIARALTQVLALVNDVPSSSSKYAFLQDLAERVIDENRAKLDAVNRVALRRGFTRTINLLGQSLESSQQHDSFLGRLVKQLPSMVSLPGSLSRVPLLSTWIHRSNGTETTRLTNLADTEMAEKLAAESLWIAEKLLASGGMEDAVRQWSSTPSLAALSLCASPQVQKPLVRLSALLCKVVVETTNLPREVCLQMVILWLPLLCTATHGGDGPIFTSVEREDVDRHLERLVAALPETYQEHILATWLQEYALSPSEWPHLQKSYTSWCSSMRKLEVDMPKVMER